MKSDFEAVVVVDAVFAPSFSNDETDVRLSGDSFLVELSNIAVRFACNLASNLTVSEVVAVS